MSGLGASMTTFGMAEMGMQKIYEHVSINEAQNHRPTAAMNQRTFAFRLPRTPLTSIS